MPDYRRYYAAHQTVFVTIVTHRRQPLFAENATVATLIAAIRRVKETHRFRHMAHVILPDHWHWLFRTEGEENFSAVVAAVKRDTSWRLRQEHGLRTPFWQDRFYDHVIRDDDDFARHLDYIHYNPVKHRVVSCAMAHAHSSFRAWVDRGVYPPTWGADEHVPESIRDMNLE